MKILSVNAGSSSLKFTLFEMPEGIELIGGYFEKIGLDDSFYSIKMNGEKTKNRTSVYGSFKLVITLFLTLKYFT